MARKFDPSTNKIVQEEGFEETRLVANTCDASGNSWASHENLLARRDLQPRRYIPPFIVHLASRIVWSGAGRVIPNYDYSSYGYALSEKAPHIWEEVGPDTTVNRPIFNTRDEPLADPENFRRLHIIAGESVMSPFANALRLASGSILLRACEVGVDFSDLELENPVHALKEISSDPTLKRKVRLADGREFSGLDLQMAVAERAIEAAEQEDYLTPQERDWANRWQILLNDLERDPLLCLDRVDWILKRLAVEREVAAMNGSNKKPGSVAFQKAVQFHRISPNGKNEGVGMLMVRKGRYQESPDVSLIENDLPLPHTRAKLRGDIVRKLRELRFLIRGVDWTQVYFNDTRNNWHRITLDYPLQSEDDALLESLEGLAA